MLNFLESLKSNPFSISAQAIHNRWLLGFEFHVAHQILWRTLATDQKWPLSSEFWARQAQREVVKIKNLDFSYWAWSTPWGHVLSLKSFCRNPALSWAIRYSVFQPVKFASTLQKLLATFFQILDIWWSSLDIMDGFKLISRTVFLFFGEINKSLFWVLSKKNFLIYF